MKFIRILNCDLSLSIRRQWKYIVFLALGMVLFCVHLYLQVYQLEEKTVPLDMQDYLFFIFGGMGEYIPTPDEPFLFPGVWICGVGFLMFLMLRYPREDFFEIGQQFVVRSGSRSSYWISKCVMLMIDTVCYFFVCYGAIFVFTVITKGSVFKSLNVEYLENFGRIQVAENIKDGVPIWLFLAPVVMVLVMSSIQLILSLATGTTIAFLGTLLLMISSSYLMTPYLVGNCGMLYRSCYVMRDGLRSGETLCGWLILCLVLWCVGGCWFCRIDILKREELE